MIGAVLLYFGFAALAVIGAALLAHRTSGSRRAIVITTAATVVFFLALFWAFWVVVLTQLRTLT